MNPTKPSKGKKKVKFFWKRVGNRPGFTLIEVMITLTILGFILLMIFGVFRLGLSAWEKGEAIKEEYQRVRIGSQLISRQIKSVVPYKIKSQKAEGDFLAFEGKPRLVKFVSTVSLRARQPEGFVYAIYEFQEGGKEGGRLVLYEQRALNKNFIEGNPPAETGAPLFENLSQAKFEYYQEEDSGTNRTAGWVEEWNAKEIKELPRAVRITLLSLKGKDGRDEPALVLLAALPSFRYEEVRTGPLRRLVSPGIPGGRP